MAYTICHYEESSNPRRKEVVDFMWAYNDEFGEIELSLVEQANLFFMGGVNVLSGRHAIQTYYDKLCDELVLVEDDCGEIVACRFVEYDEDGVYFKRRVSDYEQGLNLTFALVDDDHRENGLWERMLEYVEDHIVPKYDVNRLYLVTAKPNTVMRSVAEKNGFECVNIVDDDRDGVGACVYMKRLY